MWRKPAHTERDCRTQQTELKVTQLNLHFWSTTHNILYQPVANIAYILSSPPIHLGWNSLHGWMEGAGLPVQGEEGEARQTETQPSKRDVGYGMFPEPPAVVHL